MKHTLYHVDETEKIQKTDKILECKFCFYVYVVAAIVKSDLDKLIFVATSKII